MKCYVIINKNGSLELLDGEELRKAVIEGRAWKLWYFPWNKPIECTFKKWDGNIPWVDIYDDRGYRVDTLKPKGEY